LKALSAACLTLLFASCGGGDTRANELPDLSAQDRTAVQVATSRQLQIGYQILAVASQDDALDFCHEMCNRAHESCALSHNLCDFSKQYPETISLSARCRVSRERCRQHLSRIPRHCACQEREAS
jgi:hypothetical protein